MIATIARKELREMTRDGRLRLAAAAVLLLLAAALATGWRAWRDASALRASAERATRAGWLAQPPKNPHSAAHYGVYAFKPEPLLSFADRGVGGYVGALTWLEAHRQNDLKYRPAQDAVAAARLGEWTAAAVLQVLVPLLIVVLGFASFAGERERGTLRHLLALGVPPGRLALGKALGAAGALALVLAPAALLGAAALVLAGRGGGGAAAAAPAGDVALRTLALATAYLAYFGVWGALTLAVSAAARATRPALVVLLAVWAANVLLAPRAAADLARAVRPGPTALAFNAGVERGLGANSAGLTAEQRAAQFRDSVLRAYRVASVDALPINFAGLTLAESERHGDRVFDAAYGGLAARYRAQDRVRAALGLAAPLVAVRELSMALAGTDAEQFRDFQQAAERYRRALVARMNAEVVTIGKAADGTTNKADAGLWAQVPPFAYAPPAAGRVLARAWPQAAALGWWLLASGAALALAARRLARGGPDALGVAGGRGVSAVLPSAARAERPPARVAPARTLARLDWRLVRAGWAPRLLVIVLAVAVAYAAFGGRAWAARQADARASALAADRGRLDSLADTLTARAADTAALASFGDPRDPYFVGLRLARRWVTLPPLPLAPAAVGPGDLFPAYFRVSPYARETLYANDELENPAHLLAGRVDLAFVVAVLYPLLVIALAYDALALERERGTLRLLLAQPVRPRTVLLAKVATRAGALTAAAVALVLGGALLAGVPFGAPGAWAALALAALATACYGLVWFALALAVNVVGRASSANALALLGVWLAAVVLVPSLVAVGVGAWAPAPSRVTLVQAERAAGDAAQARAAQLLSAYMQDHPELAPPGTAAADARTAGIRNLAVFADVRQATAPVRARYEAALARRAALGDRWRWASPALVAHDAWTALAGTDAGRYRRFAGAADAYSDTLRAFYAPRVAAGARFTRADLAGVPRFAWAEGDLAPRRRRALGDAVALLALAAALTALALALLARRPLAVD